MTGQPTPPALPDWLLERALLDEVPAEFRDRVARARDTASYVERARDLADDNQRILTRLTATEVAAEVRRRARSAARPVEQPDEQSDWTGFALPALAAAVAIAALLLWTRAPGGSADSADSGPATPLIARATVRTDPDHRAKGGPRLVVHKQVGAGSQALVNGDQVRAGDRLQLFYTGPQTDAAYGAILSIDGRGAVTVHLPDPHLPDPAVAAGDSAQAVALPGAGLVQLGHSYQLDDAPGFEHFALVTSARPFALAPVVQAARALVADPQLVASRGSTIALELPATLQQTWFLLSKGDDQ